VTAVPYTLLLADDSVTIQRVIELTFADEDIDVVAVSDGDQAIARLNRSPPDIVLADIGMPGRNGYEVAQYIKQTPSLAHIPVVLLTGAFEPVDQVRAAEAGCDGVLAKPFEPQLVIGRVKELLTRPRRAPSPTQAAELDDYFDRLDVAFSKLGEPELPPELPPIEPLGPVSDEIDWHSAPPSLADAFAALLVAEQADAGQLKAPAWPALAPWSPSVIDDIVEQVTVRVLDRLSDRVIHDTVAEVVSSIAERLVGEEIERIKSSIK
jgi:CheY-like chemotaxis protein